jgi:hypothetical protein
LPEVRFEAIGCGPSARLRHPFLSPSPGPTRSACDGLLDRGAQLFSGGCKQHMQLVISLHSNTSCATETQTLFRLAQIEVDADPSRGIEPSGRSASGRRIVCWPSTSRNSRRRTLGIACARTGNASAISARAQTRPNCGYSLRARSRHRQAKTPLSASGTRHRGHRPQTPKPANRFRSSRAPTHLASHTETGASTNFQHSRRRDAIVTFRAAIWRHVFKNKRPLISLGTGLGDRSWAIRGQSGRLEGWSPDSSKPSCQWGKRQVERHP